MKNERSILTKTVIWILITIMILSSAACSEKGETVTANEDSASIERPVRKLIIDTDTVADDASALILAAKSSGVEILGVTIEAGDLSLEQNTLNALMALEIAGSDAPVYKGSEKTYDGSRFDPYSVFGSDGMGDADLVHPTGTAQSKDAVSFIIDTVLANSGEVEIVCLGPVTNIALAIEQDPDAMRQVKRIWSMGTTGLGPGNASPVAEFNVCGDVEAYSILLESNIPMTVVGLDMCRDEAMWTTEQFKTLRGTNEVGAFVADSFGGLRAFYEKNGSKDVVMNCDCLTMMCVVRSGFIKSSVQTHASCITQKGETFGQVIFYKEGFTYEVVQNKFDSYHVALVTDVEKESYFNNFIEAIK